MDFIKTSSLRALIELTFQRNWNGLIWMSRKGVTTKRVKTGPDGSIENSAQTAQSGWPRNDCFTLGQTIVRPEVSAKVQTIRPITARPGKHCPAVGQPRPLHAMPRTTMPREPGSKASRPRNLLVPRPMRRPSREDVPRPAEKHRPNLHPPTQRPTTNPSSQDRPTIRPRHNRFGRSSRPTVPTPRSTQSPF
ncbi:unnamed protein product [Microthlaspi erraticum]|uniref:Uncharacterized protein n=1 Tax=Microthlaspi erraticum TaxID=1685480 RepID=A0A6D2HGK0_9BRAS|nr:unnamed protein product [Microthlaspi erraticum]